MLLLPLLCVVALGDVAVHRVSQEDVDELNTFLQEKLNKPTAQRASSGAASDADEGSTPGDRRCVSVHKFELEMDRCACAAEPAMSPFDLAPSLHALEAEAQLFASCQCVLIGAFDEVAMSFETCVQSQGQVRGRCHVTPHRLPPDVVFGPIAGGFPRLREDVQQLARQQRSLVDRFKRDVNSLRFLLQQMALQTDPGDTT